MNRSHDFRVAKHWLDEPLEDPSNKALVVLDQWKGRRAARSHDVPGQADVVLGVDISQVGSHACVGVRRTRLVVVEGTRIQAVVVDMIGDNHRVDDPLDSHFPYHEYVVLLGLEVGRSCDVREMDAHTLAGAGQSRHRMISFSSGCVDSLLLN